MNSLHRMKNWMKLLLFLGVLVLLLACFSAAVANMDRGQAGEGRRQLEAALRKAAVACYAAEGIYPPTVAYLQAHYGVQVDESRYLVDYVIFADNLMPDITVMERMP